MAKTFTLLLFVAVLATIVLSARPGRRSYFRRYAQRRQAPPQYHQSQGGDNGNGGNCHITVEVGGGNGCNCGCSPPSEGGEPPAPPPAPPAEEPEEISPPASSPPTLENGCPLLNPFCNLEKINYPPGGRLSFEDEFCSHHYGCIKCGATNTTACQEADGGVRGQCFHDWSSAKFLEKHCQYHPVCDIHCALEVFKPKQIQ